MRKENKIKIKKGLLLKNDFILLRIDEDLKRRYIEFCDKNGFNISKRIRIFIDNDINSNGKEK